MSFSAERSVLASDNSGTFSGLLEVCVVISLIGIASLISVTTYRIFVPKAMISEAFMLSLPVKEHLHEYYAVTGRWPDPDRYPYQTDEVSAQGKYVTGIEFHSGGSFSITFSAERSRPILAGRRLTFRAAERKENSGGPIVWLCGYRAVPEQYLAGGPNHTNIEPIYLPFSCRG